MRWIEKKKFNHGDKRVIKKFLWLPTKPMFSRESRWLEYAYIEQEWLEGFRVKFWSDMRWRDEN